MPNGTNAAGSAISQFDVDIVSALRPSRASHEKKSGAKAAPRTPREEIRAMLLWTRAATRRRIMELLDKEIRPVRYRRNDVAFIAVALLEYVGGLRKLAGLPEGPRLLSQQDVIDLIANGSRSKDHFMRGRRSSSS